MDCMTFRKNINAYISGSLSDDELNLFLRHLESCPKCREELEVNYIVSEGIRLLDEEHHDYDISRAFRELIRKDERHIRTVYRVRVLTYAVDTLAFWSLLMTLLVYFRLNSF